ncbi:hypothetical protein [Streptomyces griseorubiginosus]|uniref:hypothetical protein n=1 Tax=Streptomyces griseorubiginosus TaxID=67304 RepID=UPI003F52B23A
MWQVPAWTWTGGRPVPIPTSTTHSGAGGRRLWHALWLDRIDAKITRLERQQAEEEHGRFLVSVTL